MRWPRARFRASLLPLCASWFFLCALLFGPPPFSPVARGKEAPTLKLGIFHPFPRLCRGQEPGQKERRVLRLAYGLALPGKRNVLPWFYRSTSDDPLRPSMRRITLQSEALWGRERRAASSGSLDSSLLGEWHAALLAVVPGLTSLPQPSPAGFRFAEFLFDGAQGAPFLVSRLGGTALLPFTRDPVGSVPEGAVRIHPKAAADVASGSVVDGVPAGAAASRTAPSCRDWPAGVRYESTEGKLRYRLSRDSAGRGAPFILQGYRVLRTLLGDLRRGSLQAVLLEGENLKQALARPNRPGQGLIAAYEGTQQVLLRIAPQARAALAREGIALLSRALARRALSAAAGAGFTPAKAFLQPLRAQNKSGPAAPLRWDSLGARRGWLKKERPGAALRFGVPAHPLLERMARGMAGQWKRTLNFSTTVLVLPMHRFQLAFARGELHLALDVADLDDGSLQDLWRAALSLAGGERKSDGGVAGLAALEGRLRATLPYLPLLANRHFLLAPSPRAFRRAAAVLCPGCKAVSYTAFLRGR